MHTVNDAITAILGALLPTLQEPFEAGPTLLAPLVLQRHDDVAQ